MLRYLACASVYAEKYAASANCVDLIRSNVELKDPSWMTPQLDFACHYISFLSEMGTGAVLHATLSLEQMVQSPAAAFKTCNQALVKLIQAAPQSCAEAVKLYFLLISHTDTMQSPYSENGVKVAQGSVAMLEALLAVAHQTCSDDVVDEALGFLLDDTVNSGLLACQAEYRQAYNLVFNAGTLMFTDGQFHLATKFFQCSVDFQANSTPALPDSSTSDPGRAKLLRLQARCQLESGLVDDALACVATVEALESPASPSTLLLKLRALLHMDDKHVDVLQLLQQLVAFKDPDYLIAAIRQTELSQNHEAAATCYLELDLIIQQSGVDDVQSHALKEMELLVFRLAVFHTLEAYNKNDADVSKDNVTVVVGKLLQRLTERLKTAEKNLLTAANGEYFAGVVR